MSPSMFLGRIALPVTGLAIASALAIQAGRTGRFELPTFVSAPVLPVTNPPSKQDHTDDFGRVIAEGRVVAHPGAQVVLSSEIPGTILRVLVGEKSVVRKADLLLELKAEEAKAQIDEAAARLAQTEAELARAEADQRRLEQILPGYPAHKDDVERGRFNLLESRARRQMAKAARDRLLLMLRRHRVESPIDGVVTNLKVQPGETVGAAVPLITVVDLSRLRIEAEVDEYDVAHFGLNDLATVTSEAYPGRSWQGRVEEIADTLVSRQIRPEDPGRPTDTRILPVRIALHDSPPLRLGQRVEVEIVSDSSQTKPAITSAMRPFADAPTPPAVPASRPRVQASKSVGTVAPR